MLALTLFGVFFVIALAGVPLLYAILATTVGIIGVQGLGHPMETIFLSFIGGVEPFILLAVPLFIFAGELLAQGGVGKRIVAFARVLFGWLPGGLGVVTVISCTMFGGVSGSAIADTAAIGSLVIPAMIARGYSRGFAAALLSVAGTIALLMPLSIPFLIYAFISGVSMRTLSMAGLLPAPGRHRVSPPRFAQATSAPRRCRTRCAGRATCTPRSVRAPSRSLAKAPPSTAFASRRRR